MQQLPRCTLHACDTPNGARIGRDDVTHHCWEERHHIDIVLQRVIRVMIVCGIRIKRFGTEVIHIEGIGT